MTQDAKSGALAKLASRPEELTPQLLDAALRALFGRSDGRQAVQLIGVRRATLRAMLDPNDRELIYPTTWALIRRQLEDRQKVIACVLQELQQRGIKS